MKELLVVACWIVAIASQAQAQKIELRWTAPAECPDAHVLSERLARRLGRGVSFETGADFSISGTVTRAQDHYALVLRTRGHGYEHVRRFEARRCDELGDVTTLTAALVLDESSAAASAMDSSDRDRLALSARAAVVADAGSLPGIGLGPALALGLDLNATRLELGAAYFPAQDAQVRGVELPVAALQLWAANLGACQRLVRIPALSACLSAEAGRISGRGIGLEQNLSADALWLLVSLGARARIAIAGRWYWHSQLSACTPLKQTEFAIHGLGAVHRIPSVIGRLDTGLEYRF